MDVPIEAFPQATWNDSEWLSTVRDQRESFAEKRVEWRSQDACPAALIFAGGTCKNQYLK
jgi:hypothetical protein